MDPTRIRSTGSWSRTRACPVTAARSRRSAATTRRWSRRWSRSTPIAPGSGSPAGPNRPRRCASCSESPGSSAGRVEELLAYLARQLVDNPDEVRVERHEGQSGELVLELHVAADDIGK